MRLRADERQHGNGGSYWLVPGGRLFHVLVRDPMSAVAFHRAHIVRRRQNTRKYYMYLTTRASIAMTMVGSTGFLVFVSYLLEPCR